MRAIPIRSPFTCKRKAAPVGYDTVKLDWTKDNDLTLGPIDIHIPAGALYKTDELTSLKGRIVT